MESVVLYFFQSPEIKISIDAYFNKEGGLVIDGYDIGKTVEGYFGDSDYEYILTVPQLEANRLYNILNVENGNQPALLLRLQSQFNTNTCFSDIQEFLTDHKVEHSTFSWR
jgi:hypothetical protein